MNPETMEATYPLEAAGAAKCDWVDLSAEQRASYERDGYLHLRGMFDAGEVQRGLDIIDRVVAAGARTIPSHGSFVPRSHTTRVRDAIAQDAEIGYFLDHPALIGPLAGILGINLHVLGTEIFVRALSQVPLAHWHTDGGAALQRTLLAPGSLGLQLKAQIFLTDVRDDNAGNFLLIPGTQHQLPPETLTTCAIDELNGPLDRGELPPEAVVIRAEPGDTLIFPYGLWHAVAPNRVRQRKTFIFRYGQLWHRPHDYVVQPESVLRQLSPRLRRMFGDFGKETHPTDYYKPQDQHEIMAGQRRAEDAA